MRIALIGRSELMYETAELFVAHGFEIGLIITSNEAPEYKIKSTDFEELAQRINAEFLYTAKLGDSESLSVVKRHASCKIALSVNYSGVIPQSIIDCFSLGILNAHGGDLPRYRGNACQAWAIINAEKRIGLCIHSMIGGELDNGKIISRDYFPLSLSTKISECYDWMSERIPSLFLDAVQRLDQDEGYYLEAQSLNPKDALRCYPRCPEDAKIQWEQSAETIIRLINASGHPFQGAFAYYKEVKFIIHEADLFIDSENYLAIPGQVSFICKEDGGVVVITGDGKIKIKSIEVDGKRIRPSDFIRGIRTRLK